MIKDNDIQVSKKEILEEVFSIISGATINTVKSVIPVFINSLYPFVFPTANRKYNCLLFNSNRLEDELAVNQANSSLVFGILGTIYSFSVLPSQINLGKTQDEYMLITSAYLTTNLISGAYEFYRYSEKKLTERIRDKKIKNQDGQSNLEIRILNTKND